MVVQVAVSQTGVLVASPLLLPARSAGVVVQEAAEAALDLTVHRQGVSAVSVFSSLLGAAAAALEVAHSVEAVVV
jgi:hypothetical protein